MAAGILNVIRAATSMEAKRHLERAIALLPDFADAYHLLAFVLGDLSDDRGAQEAAARVRVLNPAELLASPVDRKLDASPGQFEAPGPSPSRRCLRLRRRSSSWRTRCT